MELASRLDAFSGYHNEHSYPAMPLAGQLVHQWFVHPGPLVLGTNLLSFQAHGDRDRTVLTRFLNPVRYRLNGNRHNLGTCFNPGLRLSRHSSAKLPGGCGGLGGGDQPGVPPGTFYPFGGGPSPREPRGPYERLSGPGALGGPRKTVYP